MKGHIPSFAPDKTERQGVMNMRCYRCGALMIVGADTCPVCGFFLYSPVEIQMFEEMTDIRIYDNAKNILWSGDGDGTAHIDAPERKKSEFAGDLISKCGSA